MEKYAFNTEQQSLMEKMQVPFAVYQFIDKRVVTIALSDGFCDLFGYKDRAQAYYDMDHDMYEGVHPDDVSRIANEALRFALEGGSYEALYRTKTKNGSEYHIIHAFGKHVLTETNIRLAHVWYCDEGIYTEENDPNGSALSRKFNNALHEESLLKINHYDYLTGLPNMAYFFELAEAWKKDIMDENNVPALLFIDLSGMKFFNHKYGFSEGDKYLKSFAKILSKIFGNESCSRLGQDHFGAFIEEKELDSALQKVFEESSKLNDGNFLYVRVGVFTAQIEDVPVSSACDRAKLACDTLRETYQSCYKYYNSEMRDEMILKRHILDNFDKALEEKWIQVYYQPIVRAVNGKVCDEEALSRWIDPVMGFLNPEDFIPVLEDAGVIYKLDLYVLEQVLEKINMQKTVGLHIVPHSVNLSRNDFDSCDIVNEICKRVDAAGISRKFITIEITESVIGRDFSFMKDQVERFKKLGFPVWMDDFGSGYSSLDVLQSIQFDLLKFDMSFMRKLNEGENGRIILTELMKMASALGVGTVCEGVETEEQVRFLCEIGCSKLQGYYFCKAIPFEQLLDRYKKGIQIGFENPDESLYYDVMGSVNLYDFAVIANNEEDAFNHFFNTLPMGIIEINGDTTRFVRSNQSYRDFIKRFFGFDLSYEGSSFAKYSDSFMYNVVRTCCELGSRAFYDEKMPDGSIVHSFARKIGTNPVNGNIAVALVVLSITDPGEGTTYSDIARALAADYYNIYYVDLETERFIEYSSPVGGEELAMERHGENFFESAKRDTMTRIYEEDREPFLSGFNKENILKELDEQGVFTTTYRLVDTGDPMYVNMKIMRMQPDGKHLIIGISIIDSQMKQQELINRIQKEESAYARVMALSGDYFSLYTIDPDTGQYFEFSTTEEYDSLGLAKSGDDFFRQTVIDVQTALLPEDQLMFMRDFSKEKVLNEINEKGSYLLKYRLLINGVPKPVVLKIVPVKESDGEKLIAGVREWRDRH